MTELLIPAVVAIGTTLAFWLGRWYERRCWTRTVTHLDPNSTTVMLDSALGIVEGDIFIAFDSRTGKPRRRV